MAFDLKRWQSEVRAWWAEHSPRLKALPIDSAYALLAGSAWLPFLTTYANDPGPATTALVGITAGIGSNLVANVVQRAYDRARAGEQVTDQARRDSQTRAELDAVLQDTQTLEAAQEALGERWDDFARQLAQEMVALPGRSSLIVTLGDGTVVGGSVITGDVTVDHGMFVGGDYTAIQAETVQFGVLPPDHKAEAQERALHAYLERLAGECSVLYLRGMDPRAADVTQKETMSLAAVYTTLDTSRRFPLSDEELAGLKERGRKPLQVIGEGQNGKRPERPMSALEAASRFDRLVLLGDPGAGKSTFVNYLALRLAQAALNGGCGEPPYKGDRLERLTGWTRGPLVPLRVILRDLARSPHLSERGTATALWAFVTETLAEAHLADAAPALEKRLDGRALLLLDGLDEVEARARRRVLDAVADFALTHQHTPVLVTCRVYAYQEPGWRLTGFEEATLAPFDEEKIDQFIQAWYAEVARLRLMSASEAGEQAARLRDAARRPDLRVLAPNPLLLTMMALLHSSWGRLPEDRVQLYSEIVELLLARWEQSHLGREALTRARLSPRDLRFALEEVAYDAHSRQPAGEGTADVAEPLLRQVLQGYLEGDWTRAGDVICYIRERAGLLLERKPGVYAFPHRTLQEYLAGCHLSVQTDFPSRAADLVREGETRWREPFLLAVGKTARAENRVDLALAAVDNLCPRPCAGLRPGPVEGPAEEPAEENERAYRCAWLAGEALLEIGVDKLLRRDAWAVRLERVTGWLARVLEAGTLTPVERAGAGRVLARMGDPRDIDALVFVPGGPFTMGSGEGDKEAYDDERPQHTVKVADFCIGKYPVTNGQYGCFVEAGGYDERRYWIEAGWAWRTGVREPDLSVIEDEGLRGEYAAWLKSRPPEKRDHPFWWDDPAWNLPNHPVVGISWFEALAYTCWLAEDTGRPCRLPTEAEWEKAARGGLPPAGGDREGSPIYPWGNDEITPEQANYGETGIGRTSPVGCFPSGASPYGCVDMVGNVWEWCSSVGFTEAGYPYRADDGREDLERDTVRALRGGSWGSSRRAARCASRDGTPPDFFDDDVGFRVVFPGSPPSAS